MIWQCLNCKKCFSMALIEEEKKCINCGCTDFAVYLSEKDKRSIKPIKKSKI